MQYVTFSVILVANFKFYCGDLRDSSHFVLALGAGEISMLDLAVSEYILRERG